MITVLLWWVLGVVGMASTIDAQRLVGRDEEPHADVVSLIEDARGQWIFTLVLARWSCSPLIASGAYLCMRMAPVL